MESGGNQTSKRVLDSDVQDTETTSASSKRKRLSPDCNNTSSVSEVHKNGYNNGTNLNAVNGHDAFESTGNEAIKDSFKENSCHVVGLDTQETQPYCLDPPVASAEDVILGTSDDFDQDSNDEVLLNVDVDKLLGDSDSDHSPNRPRSSEKEIIVTTEIENDVVVVAPKVCGKVIDLTANEHTSLGMKKISSLEKDARQIAGLLNLKNIDNVYKKVQKQRLKANRVEIVTNQILEETLNPVNNSVIADPATITLASSATVSDTTSPENETFSAIFSDIDEVKYLLKQRLPSVNVDPNLIYAELEANFRNPDRVNLVVDLVLAAHRKSHGKHEEDMECETTNDVQDSQENQTNESELVDEVDIILKKFPTADQNEVYLMLREKGDCDDRLEQVIDKLLEKTKREALNALKASSKTGKSSPDSKSKNSPSKPSAQDDPKLSSEEEDLLNNDSIYRDTCLISKLFPERDKNEIYAYLEAHHDRSNRIALVTEELLQLQEWSQENRPSPQNREIRIGESSTQTSNIDPTKHTSVNSISSKEDQRVDNKIKSNVKDADVEIIKVSKNVVDITGPDNETEHLKTEQTGLHPDLQIHISHEDLKPLVKLEKDVELLRDLFPDCDPMWLYEQLASRHGDPSRVETLTAAMFENRLYPKLKDRVEKEKKEKSKQRLRNIEFNIVEFIELFPDPLVHFYSIESNVSDQYKAHCKTQLRNEFLFCSSGYIDRVLQENNSHYTPCVQELNAAMTERSTSRSKKQRSRFRQTPRDEEPMPEEPDEYFYRERLFVNHEAEIYAYLKRKEDRKKARLAEAKERNEMIECGCCFDDEILPEDSLTCPNGHLFCSECIRRSSEEVVGNAKIRFPCLSGDCDIEFEIATLRKAVSAKVFSNILRKIQEEELRQADIPNLVACPFCSFATIMENEEDKIFKCLNPECLKESCRLCREPSHIPLRCDEVERQGETSMRTFIENRMTEAMLRECYRCHKRFYKTEGCNKMTCACGASMCYVCRKPVRDYSHFGGPDGCPQDTDVMALHRQEMERAAHEARDRYTNEHPETRSTELKHEPLNHLGGARQPNHQHGGFAFGPITLPGGARQPNHQHGGFAFGPITLQGGARQPNHQHGGFAFGPIPLQGGARQPNHQHGGFAFGPIPLQGDGESEYSDEEYMEDDSYDDNEIY